MRSKSQGASGASAVISGSNRLVDALPADHRRRLTSFLRPVFLDAGTVLIREGTVVEYVHFPRTCMVSLASPFHGGSFAEVALVGNEGIVGVPLVRDGSLAMRGICAVSGWADRMDAPVFLTETGSDDLFGALVGDYIHALFGQIAQAAACNRLHSNQARLARWLLMSQDRAGSNEFAITPELLGKLLGSRPATVTLAADTLHTTGFIEYQHGRVAIIDRAGLLAVACECYASIKTQLDGVIDRAVFRSRQPTGAAPSD